MPNLLQTSDFTAPGRFHLSINGSNEATLEQYITDTQARILPRLLGCELEKLFKADLDGAVPPVPVDPIYKSIYDPFCIDSECGQLISDGMVFMLKGFTFWYYFKDNETKRTTAGAKKNQAENSSAVRMSSLSLSSFWNDSLESYRAIQKFIYDENPDDYPLFEGAKLGTVSPF